MGTHVWSPCPGQQHHQKPARGPGGRALGVTGSLPQAPGSGRRHPHAEHHLLVAPSRETTRSCLDSQIPLILRGDSLRPPWMPDAVDGPSPTPTVCFPHALAHFGGLAE